MITKTKTHSTYSEFVRVKTGRQSWVQPILPLLRPVTTLPLIKKNSGTTEAALVKQCKAKGRKGRKGAWAFNL